jgi:phosphate transport system substrate-binding protein
MRIWTAILFFVLFSAIGCVRTDIPRLDGGGATFIEPLMLKWQRVYESEAGVQVDYTGTGSGNGVQQMTHGAMLFGCTDVPMTCEQQSKARQARGEVVHIPLAMGGVVPIYHLAGLPADRPLRLSGPVLADIFLGAITRWNDSALAKLNPGVNLPSLAIKVVSRSDPSGTTAVFAEYLAKMRPEEWAACNMGDGMGVSFAVGVRQKGNPGVAGEVGRLDGAIGYVELAFAQHVTNQVEIAAVQNRAGRFVVASPESVTAAAAALEEIPTDLCFSIVDSPGPDAYPISGTDWAVFYQHLPADRGRRLVAFLRWVTAKDGGQQYVAPLGYAPLPDRVITRIVNRLDKVELE